MASDLRACWQFRANEARAGRLRMDPRVAQTFSDECDKFILGLMEAKAEMHQAGRIHGLGNFTCADQLTEMLQKLAVGDEGSMSSVIDSYLDIAHLMKETVGYSIRRTVEQDDENTRRIASAADSGM